MNSRFLKLAYAMTTALLLAACSQNEFSDSQGEPLPEGKYPLEISSVSMSVQSSSEPWNANAPQTRVAENADGSGSVWEWNGSEKIGVQLYTDGETATYTLNSGNTLTPDKTLYWKNTQQTTVKAWYPTDATVSLIDQSSSLAYVLAGTGSGNYQSPVNLTFTHALAKVRVKLEGDKSTGVTGVHLYTYTSCTNSKGTVSNGATDGWIKMKEVTYNDVTYYEANVMPNHEIKKFKINDAIEGELTTAVTPQAAKVNEITLTVGKKILHPGADGKFTVNKDDDVIIKNYTGTAPIEVNGNATITIENVKLTTEGTVMTINKGANVKLIVEGTENEFTSTNNGSGIGADGNSNITIEGRGVTNSSLKVSAGNGHTVGIGFVLNNSWGKYGDISITKVTLEVNNGTGNDSGGDQAGAAIGISGHVNIQDGYEVKCGDIKITDATVTANSKGGAACIGTGYVLDNDPTIMGTISISNSTITASSEGNSYGHNGACIGFGAISGKGNATIKKIEINSSSLNLTTNSTNKVEIGSNFHSATITDGIFVDGADKGKDGWNPPAPANSVPADLQSAGQEYEDL